MGRLTRIDLTSLNERRPGDIVDSASTLNNQSPNGGDVIDVSGRGGSATRRNGRNGGSGGAMDLWSMVTARSEVMWIYRDDAGVPHIFARTGT